MAFIAIDAKSDGIANKKKGKMTPAHHAQLNAWSLTNKTGILNITYPDGSEDKCTYKSISSATNNKVEIVFNHGYIVVCGRLIECEDGTTYTLYLPTSGTMTGSIILRFSLSNSGDNEFIITDKSGDLITEDLNKNYHSGTYEFELYRFSATPTGVTLTRHSTNTPYIDDIPTAILKAVGAKFAELSNSLISPGKPLYFYDETKGTIEERLSDLGFKSGTIQLNGNYIQSSSLFKLGTFVWGTLTFIPDSTTSYIGIIPEGFRPYLTRETAIPCVLLNTANGAKYSGNGVVYFTSNGEIMVQVTATHADDVIVSSYNSKTLITFGWDTINRDEY